MIVAERAPAKINLYLHVGEPGAHGRHPLESVVVFADVGDVVTARSGEGLRLDVVGRFAQDLDEEPDNLVMRAAREIALEAGIARPAAHLTLDKRLPVAAGLGGGSSDAAATLRALNVLWNVRASEDDLIDVARRLGADAPVCVRAKAAFMAGTGEDCSEIEMPALDGALINPDCALPTAVVFQTFDGMGLGGEFVRGEAPVWRSVHAAVSALRDMRNDLYLPALDLAPEIGEAHDLVVGDPRALLTRMTGSGATVFALCEDSAASASLAADIRRMRPSWWTAPARFGAIDAQSRAR